MLKSGKDDTYVRVTITYNLQRNKTICFELEMMMTILDFELIEEFDS